MLWLGCDQDNLARRVRHTGTMRVVGLLRGVNLGKRQLKMAELRAAVESLGHTDVETYLQSGNVVFTPAGAPAARTSGRGSPRRWRAAVGMDVPVLIRTAAELRRSSPATRTTGRTRRRSW